MIRHITTHWLTSLIGAIGGACALVAPAIIGGQLSGTDIWLAIGIATAGAVMKDPEAHI